MTGTSVIYGKQIEQVIYLIRGRRVMVDSELAALYGVTTGNLNKAVKRNPARFPTDFMFKLTTEEYRTLRFQNGILEKGEHSKYLPYAFTEEGVAMLSGVLHSARAVAVNVAIMRVFVRIRATLTAHKELAHKFAELERKIVSHDESITTLFEAIRQLMSQPEKAPKQIGFQVRERKSKYSVRK